MDHITIRNRGTFHLKWPILVRRVQSGKSQIKVWNACAADRWQTRRRYRAHLSVSQTKNTGSFTRRHLFPNIARFDRYSPQDYGIIHSMRKFGIFSTLFPRIRLIGPVFYVRDETKVRRLRKMNRTTSYNVAAIHLERRGKTWFVDNSTGVFYHDKKWLMNYL